ncbi:A-kinase anchor protein 17B isoform X2 [Anabrus simplex]
MDALRGMKLLYKDGDCAFTASIKVDFDKTKHLSEPSIRRRRIEREKLMALEREQEEKERIEQELAELHQEEERKLREEEKRLKLERRRQREEKRRQQLILKMREKETEEVNRKIALEERKLLIAQRKLESIRLLGELFERLKNVVPEQVIINKEETVTEGAVTVVQDKELQEEGATENVNPLDREKELRRRLMERFKSLHKQQSERLQMTREGKDVSSIQVVRSDFTSSDSELSSSSSNSEISLSHSSSSTEPHHGSQSSETKSGSKWKEERHSDEDKSKHYFEKRYNYPASGRNDHSYPRYSSYHYNNSHFRPFRGRRYNQSRQGVFPYRQRFRHAKGEGSYYHSLPDNAHDMHHYYEDIHQEYYKYFQKLAKQDESKDKDFTSCSQESSSCTNSRSGSQSSSKSNRTSSRLSFPSKSKYSPVNLSKSNSEESIRESHKSHPLKRKQVRSDTKTRSLTSRSRSLSLSSSNSNVQKDDSNGELVTDARSKQKRNVAKRTKNKKHHKKHKKHKHKSKH